MAKSINSKVAYVENEELVRVASTLTPVLNRALRVSSLIRSSGLISQMQLISPVMASTKDLMSFHSSDYIDILLKLHNKEELDEETQSSLEEDYGLGYDCSTELCDENMSILHLSQVLAGSSLSCAQALLNGFEVSINWFGGWHHGQRNCASGFCYVNDVVLAINRLRVKFAKILYVDLDVHHGDGVENAFNFSSNVFVMSLHLFEPGFYPGTGSIEDLGLGANGKYRTLNIPFKEGIKDDKYVHVFNELFPLVMSSFRPEAVVVQCGADCLAKDPLGGFNLTPISIMQCLKTIMSYNKPLLLLGGGGYDKNIAAKFWTVLTSFIIDSKKCLLNQDIPEDDCYYTEYGPSFEFDFHSGLRKDKNSDEYIRNIVEKAKRNLEKLARIENGFEIDSDQQ